MPVLKHQDDHQSLRYPQKPKDITDRLSEHFPRTDTAEVPPPSVYYRKLNLGAVGAKDMAAPSNSASLPPRRTTGDDRASAKQSPLDAPSPGAQRPTDGPPIFIPRASPDPRGPSILPRRVAPNNRPRRIDSDGQFQGGKSFAPRVSGPGRPQKSGVSRYFGGVSRDAPKAIGDAPTEEELAYLSSRNSVSLYSNVIYVDGATKHINTVDPTYKPVALSTETLQGMGPALACGEWGMSETVGERLIQVNKAQDEYDERIQELAQKFGEGEFCRFRSKQERVDTQKTVERNLAGEGDNAVIDEEREKENLEVMDTRMVEERAKLATRLLKGDYHVGPLGKGLTAELLERYTRKNETYLPKDSQALASKIRTLLPLDKAATRGSGARA
ncbi:MAG: hypothetical protein L6R40_004430 [Gallowayella cf. fulva]|nr:MAG: hypothetical protein L6R40_004430 [Xanthomendoza cf. fulva]